MDVVLENIEQYDKQITQNIIKNNIELLLQWL